MGSPGALTAVTLLLTLIVDKGATDAGYPNWLRPTARWRQPGPLTQAVFSSRHPAKQPLTKIWKYGKLQDQWAQPQRRRLGGAQSDLTVVTEPQVGDLLLRQSDGAWKHVGVYVGEGKLIDAPATGSVVRVSSYNASKWD